MATTFENVADIIADTSEIDRDTITPDSHTIDDLGIDSLDFLDIVFAIDKEFGIKIPLEQWKMCIRDRPGVVVAYLINIPLAIGAFIAGMVCALSAAFISERSRIKEDTALGIVFATMFGLGIVLYVAISTDVHLDHILYGDMLGVSWSEIQQTLFIAIVVAAFLLIWRKDLLVVAFDPQHARAISLPMIFLHYGLLSAIALMAVAALNAVGIILAIAFLITPGAVAFLITRVFRTMMVMSVLVAVSSTILGIYISFFIDSAPAPTIVMVMTTFFIAAFIYASRRPVSGETN